MLRTTRWGRLAQNFEIRGVSSAWDVHGMHPGNRSAHGRIHRTLKVSLEKTGRRLKSRDTLEAGAVLWNPNEAINTVSGFAFVNIISSVFTSYLHRLV